MQMKRRWMVVGLAAAGLGLCGCAEISASEPPVDEPVTLVEIDGSDVKQVIITQRAAERLDIQMGSVTEEAGVKVVPYASVVYDPNGGTWVYASPEPLTFVRTSITVSDIEGERAFLSAGPDRGTEVVTVGTAELYGAENEIGH